MYITTQNIYLIPDEVVARNLIIIFNFSGQRPHLNYISLSNVYYFDTMEFSMKHKQSANFLIFTNKASSHVVIESLRCAKVVVLMLGAILFYSGIHFKPLKFVKDLNRHHCTKNLISIKFTQCKCGAKKCKLRLNKRQRW